MGSGKHDYWEMIENSAWTEMDSGLSFRTRIGFALASGHGYDRDQFKNHRFETRYRIVIDLRSVLGSG